MSVSVIAKVELVQIADRNQKEDNGGKEWYVIARRPGDPAEKERRKGRACIAQSAIHANCGRLK